MADYTQVWEILKIKSKVVLEVKQQMVSRVRKGVTNKKYKDRVFHAMRANDHYYLDFSYDRATCKLTIQLKRSIGEL